MRSCQLWDRRNISKSGVYEWAQKAIELDDQNYVASLINPLNAGEYHPIGSFNFFELGEYEKTASLLVYAEFKVGRS